MERCHTVKDMRHGSCSVGNCHTRFLNRCRRMSDAYADIVCCTVSCQFEILVTLGSHCYNFNQSVGSLLIPFELLNIRFYNALLRLCSLVYHIQIRSFKMNSEDFRSLIAIRYDLCDIFHCLGKYLLCLCDCGRTDSGNTLLGNVFHPVSQAFFFCIIGVKAISTMCMNVNESRYNSSFTIVLVSRFSAISQNIFDFSILQLQLGFDELTEYPYSLTLNNHEIAPPLLISLLYYPNLLI